jgi:uncharacterized membrane protein YciS (DUF1049 family)
MWFLRNIIWLAIMIVVVGFAILNLNETVTAVRLPGREYRLLSLNVVLFVAFVIGMITAFALTLIHHLRSVGHEPPQPRDQDLKRELAQLRNLPIEDLRIGEERSATKG